ncbi:CUB and sushi domain-containing protein 2 [Mactra antiquata]
MKVFTLIAGVLQKSLFGAKLAEPRGYVINDEVLYDSLSKIPWFNNYWIGYNRLYATPDDGGTVGYWSDRNQTNVAVGVWGNMEPNMQQGDCTYVSTTNGKWYMNDCATTMNFVCELDPCPAGVRDTFMCNGKCLHKSFLCNGDNDCGNNEDELNCNSTCSGFISYTQQNIIVPANDNVYPPRMTCTWAIKVETGKRINIMIDGFSTEPDSDFLDFYDGGISMEDSSLSVRLSGNIEKYSYISSYNFIILRFVSDGSQQSTGFILNWDTEFDCPIVSQDGYSVTDDSIVYDEVKLATLVKVDYCKKRCTSEALCTGFRYEIDTRKCYFINSLPLLREDIGSTMYLQTCNSDTSVQGTLPLMKTHHVATSSVNVLATPMYPNVYVGNLELEYTITTAGNNLITLEVLSLDLCCGDSIDIYDDNKHILANLDSQQTAGMMIISTSNIVYVRMDLKQHWKCTGGLIQYKQGCDISVTGSGVVTSPGYNTPMSYPDLMVCTWRINAPSLNRSVTVLFDSFDIHPTDTVRINYNDGMSESYTGTLLQGLSLTAESYLDVTMVTSSLDNGPGFSASFSPGCPVLNGDGYMLSSNSFNYGDSVTITCGDGFYFTGEYADTQEITVQCLADGYWNMENIPLCEQGKCIPPPFIDNGYIVTSSGSLGGDQIEYTCKHGYTLTGNAVVTCGADGLWEILPMCVAEECSSLRSDDIHVEALLGNGTEHGSVVRLTCDDNYEIIGAQTVGCSQGDWDFVVGTQTSYCDNIPCETPFIDNAVLVPSPPYVQNQEISVHCLDGFRIDGQFNTFHCGSEQLPACKKVNCSLSDFANVIPVSHTMGMVYMYGESVDVKCLEGYYLTDTTTTKMTITCESNGHFSKTPECDKKGCGPILNVKGSVYSPVKPCYDDGCSFTFECRSKYKLIGSSSLENNTVTCGLVNDGLWDFGSLTCIGGQCPDPGYPPSGSLIGDSFEEGATVNFTCNRNGYQPYDSHGKLSTGIKCIYDAFLDKMVWDGDVPTCIVECLFYCFEIMKLKDLFYCDRDMDDAYQYL